MSLSNRLARGVKATFLARAVQMLANAALLLLLARYLLDPQGYGLLYFAISVLGIAGFLGQLGLPNATARYVTEYYEKDRGQVPHLLRRTLLYVLALVAVVGVVLVAASGVIAELLDEPALAPFLAVGALYVAFRATNAYLSRVFQGFNRVTLSAILQATNGVGRAVFAIGFVLAGFGALGALLGYVVGYVLASAVGLVALYWLFYRRIDPADQIEPGLIRRVAEYSVPTTATEASVILDSKVDTVLVGVLLSSTAVGYYTLAAQVAELVIAPAQSLGFTISPALGEQKAEDSIDRAARIYETSLEHVLALYVPAGVGIVLVADPAIRTIFGADYAGAIPALQVFGLLTIVRAIHKVTGSGLDYLGLARIRAIARGATAVANVGLNLALIPVYGVVGAAVATLVTYTAYTAVNVYYIARELDLRAGRILGTGARICAVTAVMAGVVFLALPHVSGLPTLLGTVALGGAIAVTLSIATGVLDVARVRALLL